MLWFYKMTSGNLKIRKLPSATLNFQELFLMKFDSKSNWFEAQIYVERIYYKKNEKKGKCLPSPVK